MIACFFCRETILVRRHQYARMLRLEPDPPVARPGEPGSVQRCEVGCVVGDDDSKIGGRMEETNLVTDSFHSKISRRYHIVTQLSEEPF